MYKEDLVLNNLQWLICYNIKPNQTLKYKYLKIESYFSIILSWAKYQFCFIHYIS